jgi:hypothetical protein
MRHVIIWGIERRKVFKDSQSGVVYAVNKVDYLVFFIFFSPYMRFFMNRKKAVKLIFQEI